ncbi:Transmembrane protein 14C [Borealophlyctis nickersoniae]|nr:Transmembrane protein 14C [Borealophlyctis nickersoniae]
MPPKDQPTPAPNPAARQFTAYPSRTDYFAYAYAALVFFGGIMGFLKAGSLTSLYMGAGAGTVLGYGARLASVDRRRVEVLFGVSAVLMISMGNRFAKNRKFPLYCFRLWHYNTRNPIARWVHLSNRCI